jgi:hypothetical protein
MTLVTQGSRQLRTDQWFQWADYTRDGRLAVSYYDRQYGNAELTGASDFTLSGSRNLSTFASVRVTSSSMPAPTQFSGLFWGDYTGLTAWFGTAHTRLVRHPDAGGLHLPRLGDDPPRRLDCAPPAALTPANDQEAMTASLAVPTPR